MIRITSTERNGGKISVKFKGQKKKTFDRTNTLLNILIVTFLYFWR